PYLDWPLPLDHATDEGRHEMGRARIEIVVRPIDQSRPKSDAGSDATKLGAIPFELLFEEAVDPADAEPVTRPIVRDHRALGLGADARRVTRCRAQQHDALQTFRRRSFEGVDADAKRGHHRADRIA